MAHMERLAHGEATFKNNRLNDGLSTGIVAGFLLGDDGKWITQLPTGMPKDLLGRAECELKKHQAKQDIKNRLRAKLEAKKRAREKETHTETCECGAMLGGRDDWDEDEFDEHPDREAGYDEDGQWHCPECREDK